MVNPGIPLITMSNIHHKNLYSTLHVGNGMCNSGAKEILDELCPCSYINSDKFYNVVTILRSYTTDDKRSSDGL